MLFGMPRLVIFLGRCRIGLFSINVCNGVFSLLRSVIFFFSYSITAVQCHPKWTSVECARNYIGYLDGKLFERQWKRKHPRWYAKYYFPSLMENKNIAQCRPKYKHSSARISGEVCPQISVGCSLRLFWAIAFLFNPWIIFDDIDKEMFDWLHPVILFGVQRPVIFLGRWRLELFFIHVCRGVFFAA